MKKLIFKKLAKDVGLFFVISAISISIIIWIIQAVNYLDLVSEDGHSLRVYFLYTIYSLPKIISKILPFIFMISLFYIIIKYEINNELIIYWIVGISKLNFVHQIIKISFYYFIIQIFLTTIIVPHTLDKGRSFFRTSNIDLFSSIIKEKKFIDTIKDLTIFVESKNNNLLKNVIIKERINDNQSQITIAQEGVLINDGLTKKIILKDGKIINHENKGQKIIDFSEFSLDLAKYNTNTITHPKTQEMNSMNLIRCLNTMWNYNKFIITKEKKTFSIGCNTEIFGSIVEETLKRFFSPVFIILIGLSSGLIVLNNKDNKNYKFKNGLIFFLCIALIFASEVGLRQASMSMTKFATFLSLPFFLFILIYLYFLFINRFKRIRI